jgi:cbb3-type cytochrome oxidase subunit 1
MGRTLRPAPMLARSQSIAVFVAACGVVGFWSLPITLYCWEGAYNVMQGGRPRWLLAALLVALGLIPWAAAGALLRRARAKHSFARALASAAVTLALVSLPVLFVRVALAAPFF